MSITEHEIETVSAATDDDKTERTDADWHDDKAEPTDADTTPAEPKPAVKATADEPEDAGDLQAVKSDPAAEKSSRRVSISVRSLALAAVIAVLIAGVCALGWLYLSAENKLSAQARAAANNKHAQEIALDYAVHAAEMKYQDLNSWKAELVKHTSPELKEKLTKAANDMEQILEPLQWNSTARPLAAIVRSDAGGTYTVDSFISVLTKTVQAPEGLQSTATYSLTIDSNKDWLISDVGGIDAALGAK